LGLVLVLGAAVIGDLVPRLGAQVDTLRLLAAAFPLLTVNAVEVHVRSGRGRNREVLAVNVATLAFNLPLCILLIVEFGLPGAACALVLSELWQALLLWITAARDERALVGPSVFVATAGAVLLTVMGAAIGDGRIPLAALAVIGTVAVVAGSRWRAGQGRSRAWVSTRGSLRGPVR
jgi:O-antigen/teichoic acid export membrane protein